MFYLTPTLSTEHLVLKRGTLEDFQKVYEYDFRKLRDICGEFAYVKLDPQLIKGFETAADEEDTLNWILYTKEDLLPIGDLVADRVNPELRAIELAFNLHPAYWGKGYMVEAVVEAMAHLFSLGFENILCGYDEGNVKSKRVIEKMGFEPYKTTENAWMKNGVPITNYLCILSKENFERIYANLV
ncbi:MAG: GNAT family N-acetyltransferase [Clostridia bacterium]|nr:GNAT family N-acetyltransferase [Clostridia bacterium]